MKVDKRVIQLTRLWRCLLRADHPLSLREIHVRTGIQDRGALLSLLQQLRYQGRVRIEDGATVPRKRYSLEPWTPPRLKPAINLGLWQPKPFNPELYRITNEKKLGKQALRRGKRT